MLSYGAWSARILIEHKGVFGMEALGKNKILGWYLYENGRNIVFGKHWGQWHFLCPFILVYVSFFWETIYVSDDKEADVKVNGALFFGLYSNFQQSCYDSQMSKDLRPLVKMILPVSEGQAHTKLREAS